MEESCKCRGWGDALGWTMQASQAVLLLIFRAEGNHQSVERVLWSDVLAEVENRLKGAEQTWLAMDMVQARPDGRSGKRAVRCREGGAYQSHVEANLQDLAVGCTWG